MTKHRLLTDREKVILDRLEGVLRHRGVAWATLATMVGRGRSSGSQWSGRLVFPREATLHKIAGALDVTTAWLLTGDDPSQRLTAQTTTEGEILETVRALPLTEQKIALAMLKGLLTNMDKK